MTRESKVGLFVGLAFIILFAVVIAEKGQANRRTSPPDFGIAQSDPSRTARPVAGTDRSAPIPDEGRLPVDRVLPNPNNVVAMKPPPSAGGTLRAAKQGTTLAGAPARPTLGLPEIPPNALAQDNASDATHPKEELALGHSANPLIPPPSPNKVALPADAASTEAPTPEKSRQDSTRIPKPVEADRPGTPSAGTMLAQGDRLGVSARDAEASRIEKLKTALNGVGDKTLARGDAHRAGDAGRTPPTDAKPEPRTHTIAKGDSLFTIARHYYGKASPQVVDALYEANRHTLKSRNAIVAGQELVIPVVAGYENKLASDEKHPVLAAKGTSDLPRIPQSLDAKRAATKQPIKLAQADPAKTAEHTGRPHDAEKASSSGGQRAYVVRRNDTLARIAARELGDAGRAGELLKLNHDRVTRPDRLAVGTSLRLPPREAVGGKEPGKPAKESLAAADAGKSAKTGRKSGKPGKPAAVAARKSHSGKASGDHPMSVASAHERKSRSAALRDGDATRSKTQRGEKAGSRPTHSAVKRTVGPADREALTSPGVRPA